MDSDGNIMFGDEYTFPRDALTGYKSNQGKGDFYKLKAVLVFYQCRDKSFKEQMDEAKKQGVGMVHTVDKKVRCALGGGFFSWGHRRTPTNRRFGHTALSLSLARAHAHQPIRPNRKPKTQLQDLLDYLSGTKDTARFVEALPDHALLDGTQPHSKRKRTGDGHSVDDGTAEQAAVRAIVANERQLRDRNSLLSVPGRNFKKVIALMSSVLREDEVLMKKEKEDEKRAMEAKSRRDMDYRKARNQQQQQQKTSSRYQRETAPDLALQQLGAQNLGLTQVAFAGTAAPPGMPMQAADGGGSGGAGPTQSQPPPPPPPPPPPSSSSHPPRTRTHHNHSHHNESSRNRRPHHHGPPRCHGPLKPPKRSLLS